MKDSEYNVNRVKNSRGSEAHEFGFIPKKEFSREKPEIGKTPESEVNSSFTHVNAGHKEAAPTESAKKVIESATRASTISAGVHTAVVAATVVSTAVIGAAVGIKSVTDTRAEASFSSFIVEEDSLFYALNLVSSKEDALFDIRVYNYSYDRSQEVHVGENEGRFDRLAPDQTYTVEISQRGVLGNTIYKESFYCAPYEKPEYVPTFRGFIFDKTINYFTEEFLVQLDYEDDIGAYESFELSLTQLGEDPFTVTYELEKTLEPQTISCLSEEYSFDYLHHEFSYELTVFESGTKKSLGSDTFTFADNSGLEILLNDPLIDNEIHLEGGFFFLALDYKDPYGRASSFVLHIDTPDGNSYLFPLEKTLERQVIKCEEAGLDPLYLTDGVTLRLGYLDQESNEALFYEDDLIFTPVDQPIFIEGALMEEANFASGEIYVELSFEDPGDRMETITLYLTDIIGNEYSFALAKTTERQTLFFADNGYGEVKLNATDTWQYSFAYSLAASPLEETIFSEGSLTFKSSSSPIRSFSFPKTADFNANSFSILVEFDESDSRLTGASFLLKSEEDPSLFQIFDIPIKSGEHTFTPDYDPTGSSGGIDLSSGQSFSYALNYTYGEDEYTYESGSVVFSNSSVSHFDSLSFDYALSDDKNFVFYHADYEDPERIYTSLMVTLTDDDGNAYTWYNELLPHGFIDLSYDTEAVAVPVDQLLGQEVTFKASTIAWVDEKEITTEVLEEQVILSRESVSKTFGLQLVSKELNKSYPNLSIIPFIIDDAGSLHDFRLGVTVSDGSTYHFPIPLDSSLSYPPGSTTVELSSALESSFDLETFLGYCDEEVSLSLAYSDSTTEFEFRYLEHIRFDIIN